MDKNMWQNGIKKCNLKKINAEAQLYWGKWHIDNLRCFGGACLMDAVCFVADSAPCKRVREHLKFFLREAAASLLPYMPDHDWRMESRPARQLQPYYGSVCESSTLAGECKTWITGWIWCSGLGQVWTLTLLNTYLIIQILWYVQDAHT